MSKINPEEASMNAIAHIAAEQITATKRYIVVSPQESQGREVVGSYAEQFGWAVRDSQANPATTGQVFWSGSEREMRRTARELNASAR